MSWVTGARRDFPASLQIQGDSEAYVEFTTEPTPQSFGKKKNRQGEEVDDIRVRARVTYLKGTAWSKKGKDNALPAKMGEEYTLWIGATLKGAILDLFEYKEGPAPEIVGTQIKVWRGEVGSGGHKVYCAALLDENLNVSEKEEVPGLTDEEFIESLAKAIRKLENIDKPTWYKFCVDKGAKTPEEAERITNLMAEQNILTVESTKIVAVKE